MTETATRTLERIEHFDEATNQYAQMAHEQYGENIEQYRQAVITAVESLDSTSAETPTAGSSDSLNTKNETADADTTSATPTAESAASDDHVSSEQDRTSDVDTETDASDNGLGNFESDDFE